MENKQIRVLHSVAPAQTYILSRSPSPIQIYLVNESSSGNPPQFASVSLKSCMDILYISSPELFSNTRKDFSVYCLDPLESPASVASTSTSTQTVSVACGRLSAIRSSDGRAMVTGTLVKDRVGHEALQLVFVLCETVAVNQMPDLAAAARINAALARQTEENDRAKRRRQKQTERRPSRPAIKTEADRILEESGDMCLIRPGDPSWTQPAKSTPFAYRFSSAQSGHSTSSTPLAHDRHAISTISSSAASSLQNISPELLSVLETVKHNPQVNSEALFRVISFIDSAMKENAALTVTDALRKLAPSQTSAGSTQVPQTPPRTPPAPNAPTSPDDGIVVLDKENVNPSAFGRRTDRDAEDGKAIAATNGLLIGSLFDPPPVPQQQVGPSQPLQSNTTFNNEYAPARSITRKRTLSEVLDDSRSLGRIQGRLNPLSSPPRPTTHMSPGYSKDKPIVIPDSPSMPKPGGQRANSRARLKVPYVVPDWARTKTAMQPRLSEETQLTMKEAEQRKREEKLTKRMKWSQQRKSGPIHRTISTPAVFSTGADEPVASGSRFPSSTKEGSTADPPPPPTVLDPLLPVIAVADTSISLPSSPHRLSSPPVMSPVAPPCTPPRRRGACSSSSPEEEFSLFTPRGMVKPTRDLSVFKSPSIAQSPSIRLAHRRDATPPPSSEPVAEDDSDKLQGDDLDDEDFLTRELHGALEETDIPAASSVEQSKDEHTMGTRGDPGTHQPDNNVEEDENESDKPFWPGLPPSSPPPQSSPLLQPLADESSKEPGDDFELPMASSDFDIDEIPPQTGGLNDPESVFADPDDGVGSQGHLDDTALAAILEMLTNTNDAYLGSSFVADYSEDIFENLGAIVDETQQGQHLDTAHSDNLSEFPSDITLDNAGFWSAIGPLLDQTSNTDTALEEPDPIKNLLSGCVL
ncbi:hypothetical protein DFJ43DRAFT_197421 [Lentinula guzmanii]|uniref:Ams2/SPT21 N-terminal domain-containing protein n=1 Tax=Lentinula guzmanii TaxID=2804957 RepID=A0AA38JKV1_9AGAR|nr:hypothetical protein DFJ43DRAFT_197421 [Lentinula guzmanii]